MKRFYGILLALIIGCTSTQNVAAMFTAQQTPITQVDWAETKKAVKLFFEQNVLPKLKQLNEFAEGKEKTCLPKLKEKAQQSFEKFVNWLSPGDSKITIDEKDFKVISIAFGCFTGLMFPLTVKLGLLYIIATRAWPLIAISQKRWWQLGCSRLKINATAKFSRLNAWWQTKKTKLGLI
jgi:hypothetical protein